MHNLRPDLFGGLTAAVVALPLALAFGVASGAGPVAGLYGAICVGFFAAVFGGTPAQISGPTGPMTVVMAVILTRFAHEPAMAFTVVIMGGALQILFGALRFGRYINLVPYPVVSGFMSGIGVIIIILQVAPLLGHPAPTGDTLTVVSGLPAIFAHPNADVALGLLAFGVVCLLPARVHRILPAPLVALVLGTLLAYLLFENSRVIGPIPTGLPEPQLPVFSLESFPLMVRYALVLAFLGSIDSLLTSLVADSITRTYHKSNRELVGQGIGNMVAGLFGGIPGAGATMRTVVNVRAGGRTPLSGAVHAVVLLLVVLGLGSFAEFIPHAVLAGILLKVGIDIIDWKYLRRALHAPRAGMLIMLSVLLLTVFVDLITAVAVGTIAASLLFVKRMADVQLAGVRSTHAAHGLDDLTPEETAIVDRGGGRIVLFHVEGPLSFGSARDMARVLTSHKEQDALVIDLSDVPFIDSSASLALEEVIEQARADGDVVVLCGASEQVARTLSRVGVIRLLHKDNLLSTRLEALKRAETLLAGPSG